jgi:putative DNA primase/helicase
METDAKLQSLTYYLKKGWPIFPCKVNGKEPLTAHGFLDASLDPEAVKAWHAKYPQANWAVRTGALAEGGAGLVVVDVDDEGTWEILRRENPQIQTVQVRTGGGGSHLYFKYPEGRHIKSGTNVLGRGIDIRAEGGYVIVPPSVTTGRYAFEVSPADTEIQEVPEMLLDGPPKVEVTTQDPETVADNLKAALSALNALKKVRADDYQSWLEVGMSLFELGQDGLVAWDQWSKQSENFQPGACAQKWTTFSPDLQDATKISFGSLIHWAEEDGCAPFIRSAPRKAKPSHYVTALTAFGYKFSCNDMNDMIYLNGGRMSDLLMSKIMTGLREFDYKSKEVATDAMASMALENKFHPIKDYLEGLKWDGVDHIGNLCEFIKDKDGVFHQIFRAWLLGAVGRILGPRPGQQHPMLVLDGVQGLGKSRFVWWLGSPLPAYYIQNAINTDDKDFLIQQCSKFVWEVEELDTTLRRADVGALKAFLSKEIINVRKPYGHDEIVKPATASYIGTINSSGGFLADPTGSRRFRVCTLTSIDWNYDKHIDVNQVWAQAVASFRDGGTWELDKETQSRITEINGRYDVDDPIAFDIFDTFSVDPAQSGKCTAAAQIIHRLRADGRVVGGSDHQVAIRIANVLVRLGCVKGMIRVNGQVTRVWCGVWPRGEDQLL